MGLLHDDGISSFLRDALGEEADVDLLPDFDLFDILRLDLPEIAEETARGSKLSASGLI